MTRSEASVRKWPLALLFPLLGIAPMPGAAGLRCMRAPQLRELHIEEAVAGITGPYKGHPPAVFQSRPGFQQACRTALQGILAEGWMLAFQGVNSLNRSYVTRQGIFVSMRSCRPHDCLKSDLFIRYNPASNRLIGARHIGSRTILLGIPTWTETRIIEAIDCSQHKPP